LVYLSDLQTHEWPHIDKKESHLPKLIQETEYT
jgi:hypothetical protein